MGIISKWLSKDQADQDDYNNFMTGFREGYPLVGEPAGDQSDEVQASPQYQKGLDEGRQRFERDGRPQIPYNR